MKKILYLGTDPQFAYGEQQVIHYPVIRTTLKKSIDFSLFEKIAQFPFVLFTSKNTVFHLFERAKEILFPLKDVLQEKCISIGPSTSASLCEEGVRPIEEAVLSTQEGLIAHIASKEGPFFYPRSSRARSVLADYLKENFPSSYILDLYDTVLQRPFAPPCLSEVSQIIFTSPSTVEGFCQVFGEEIPSHIQLVCQGPITQDALERRIIKKIEKRLR